MSSAASRRQVSDEPCARPACARSRARAARFDRDPTWLLWIAIIAVLLFLVVSPFVYLVVTSFQAEKTGAFTLPTTPTAYGRARYVAGAVQLARARRRRRAAGRRLRRAARLGGLAHRHAGPWLRRACWCSATFITPPYTGAVAWILLAGPERRLAQPHLRDADRRRGGAVQHLQLSRPGRRHRALFLSLHLHLHHGGARAGLVRDGGRRQHPGRRHLAHHARASPCRWRCRRSWAA